jgi:Leucine-rich repeat (LRR) protein
MDSLVSLGMTENLLFGSIPTYYGLLWNLRDFRVAGSGVGGFLPTEIALLSNLIRLDIANNNFKGTLMTEIGKLTNLCKFLLLSK